MLKPCACPGCSCIAVVRDTGKICADCFEDCLHGDRLYSHMIDKQADHTGLLTRVDMTRLPKS